MASPDVMTPIASLMLERAAAGTVAATAIALVARPLGSLSTSGAVATIVVGSAAAPAGGGGGGGGPLSSSSSGPPFPLSRLGRAEKERLTGGVVAKGGARDA